MAMAAAGGEPLKTQKLRIMFKGRKLVEVTTQLPGSTSGEQYSQMPQRVPQHTCAGCATQQSKAFGAAVASPDLHWIHAAEQQLPAWGRIVTVAQAMNYAIDP